MTAETTSSWPFFPRIDAPMLRRDDPQMARLQRANPEAFRVERLAEFATIQDAYLPEHRVDAIWDAWPDGHELVMQHAAGLDVVHYFHGDPSKSGANFGHAIAHAERGKDGLLHIVFDYLGAWLPKEFTENRSEIDYEYVFDRLCEFIDRFMPTLMTFDQFNSAGIIQRLRKYARDARRPKSTHVEQLDFTRDQNWRIAENFKTAIGLGLVHAPYFELADLELKRLRDVGGKVTHPTSGDTQTKDVADCMMILTSRLIGAEVARLIGEQFAAIPLGVAAQGGFDPSPTDPIHQQLSNFGRSRQRIPAQNPASFTGHSLQRLAPTRRGPSVARMRRQVARWG